SDGNGVARMKRNILANFSAAEAFSFGAALRGERHSISKNRQKGPFKELNIVLQPKVLHLRHHLQQRIRLAVPLFMSFHPVRLRPTSGSETRTLHLETIQRT